MKFLQKLFGKPEVDPPSDDSPYYFRGLAERYKQYGVNIKRQRERDRREMVHLAAKLNKPIKKKSQAKPRRYAT